MLGSEEARGHSGGEHQLGHTVYRQQRQAEHYISILQAVMWIRIRIHLGPWIRIRGYKMKEKTELNQQMFGVFFVGNYFFSSLKLK